MENGLNNYIKGLSYALFIHHGSAEREKINLAMKALIKSLKIHFGDEVSNVEVFGSYRRDTIIPRQFDRNSDVDILVKFNTEQFEELKPESYRNKLERYGRQHFAGITIGKDHPSIILAFEHINVDLVPAISYTYRQREFLEIPDKDGRWMATDPEEFTRKVIDANVAQFSIIKPMIRLMKGWNAAHDYPFQSYALEVEIAEMNLYGENYQTGLLFTIDNLSSYGLSKRAEQKLDSLKKNGYRLAEYLDQSETGLAKKVLHKIFKQLPRLPQESKAGGINKIENTC